MTFQTRSLVLAVAVAGLAGSAARASSPTATYREYLDGLIEKKDWAQAMRAVEEARTTNYGSGNEVLYNLDKACLLHYAAAYADSDAVLDRAELRIEELYTKSLHQAAGTILVNDATQDYAGEPHERALLYVMRALNYAALQRIDDAVVEARKVTSFLSELGERVGMRTYREDAFAQLLSAMLYEDAGRLDDSRIAWQAAEHGYALYQRDYGVPLPRFAAAARQTGQGELVVIHYNGKAPLRVSTKRNVPVGAPPSARALAGGASQPTIALALPAIAPQPYAVKSSEVKVGSASAATVLVEPVGSIVTQSLADQLDAIQARATLRVGAKGGLAEGAGQAAGRSGLGSAVGSFISATGRSAASAVEEADTRAWTAIPAEIRMARLAVAPGVHSVRVEYKDDKGAPVAADALDGVEIAAGYRTYVLVRSAN